MGRTYVSGVVFGSGDTRGYEFFVDAGSAIMGLPMGEIEALGLEAIPNGRRRFMTDSGAVWFDTYHIKGEIWGRGFAAMVAPCPVPLVGYEMLQTMRLRVNPVSEEIEEVPDDVFHPPYFIGRFT